MNENMNRRTMLKTCAVIPLVGALPKLNKEPIIIHYTFCDPAVSGHWIDVGKWEYWKGEPPRGVHGFARRGLAYIKQEFAGYHSKTIEFQVNEPVWGEVIFEERWYRSKHNFGGLFNSCVEPQCICKQLDRKSPFKSGDHHEQRIVEYTPKTMFAPKIGWGNFSKVGYDKLWPIKYRVCIVCGKTATTFFHVGEKKIGFYCSKCAHR